MAYQYRGDGTTKTPAEAEAALRRNGISPALATSQQARALEPVPALKGAVKVTSFPEHGMYPWPEIAADGGIWKLDAAAFTWRGKPTKPVSVRAAASKWASEHGLRAKVVIDGGSVYVQFRKQP